MNRCKLLIIPCLAMSFALSWGFDQGRARAEEISQPIDSTTNADSQQTVPRRKKTTNAQREEAAKLRAQQRAEQLMKETTAAPPTDQATPAVEKGGTGK